MRAYNTWRYPKRVFEMPPGIKAIVERREAEKQSVPEYAPPSPEPKDMSLTSKRVGCIAVKAGMTQEWDEHGTKVPLTVLFVDDCQVRARNLPSTCKLVHALCMDCTQHCQEERQLQWQQQLHITVPLSISHHHHAQAGTDHGMCPCAPPFAGGGHQVA